jgi:hypothetical protein
MKFVVKTQYLENYGAHDGEGRFQDGQAYWKFKGGNDYIVSDVERAADAMAFVMAKYSNNNIHFKEFPTEVVSLGDWETELNDLDADYRAFIKSQAVECSPLAA